jgi:DNA-binding beta-propeller fold protein YncE
LHFEANGNLVQTLGKTSPGCPYATIPPKVVQIGTFCEPWAVAISPDGEWIYVADTWNHRIQKLSADGKPVMTWGMPNYDPVSSDPFGLWGPRDIIVDSQGHVLVTDTGNKRVLIYDENGNFVFQLGGEGTGVGQFDEPVGLALDSAGNLYIADTWNQRVQVFSPSSDKKSYSNLVQWDVSGWSSQSLDNKPYIAVDKLGHVFTTDPDSFRVLELNTSGVFVRAWGKYGSSSTDIGMPSGISVDEAGRIWVSDTANNRIMRFVLP